MKISVIISTYNRPHYLKRVMEGYLNQSLSPDELVIADDGSSQETASMVEEVSADTRINIKHLWQEDRGFRAAAIRNRAIAESCGEYLVICDDDSIPCRDLVGDHLKYAEENCFIQGHRVLLKPAISKNFTHRDISRLSVIKLSMKGQASNIINAFRFPLPLIKVSHGLGGIRSCNMSFFKKDIIAVNGFNEDFVGWGKEDSEMVVRLFNYGVKRKDLKFRACCYHLYHEHYETDNLQKNIALLNRAQQEKNHYCRSGIDKHL